MQQDDAPGRHAERDRRLDEGFVLEGSHLGVDQAGEPGPVSDGQRQDHVLDGGAQRLRDGNGEHDLRHGEEDVGHAHQRLAQPVASPSGDEADRNADQERGADRDDGNGERDARTEQDAAVDVGPHAVGAEEVDFGRRLQAMARIHVPHRIGVRGEQWGQDGDRHEQDDDEQANCGGRVAQQLAQDAERGPHAALPRGSRSAWKMSTIRLTMPNTTPA